MSILAIAFPAQAAVPVAATVAGSVAALARSSIGIGLIGILVTLLLVFKPLLKGMLKAALLILHPRNTKKAFEVSRAAGMVLLNRLAREMEQDQPNQAAELRWLASHS